MNFRLSQKLAKKIKEDKGLKKIEAHAEPLADWSANIFVANRTQYVVCCNTASLYSCVFFGRGITDDNTFIKAALRAIRDTMEDDNLEDVYQERIVPHTGSLTFGKALNRSVTGSMIDQVNCAKSILENPLRTPFEATAALNKNLLSYLDYKRPNEIFREFCQTEPGPTRANLPSNVIPLKKPDPNKPRRSKEEKLWQQFAKTFQITEHFIRADRLPKDFYPEHAVALFEEPLSTQERSTLSFLLHVWNRYEYPFELSEVAGWSEEHQRALGAWVMGRSLDDLCRYF